MNITKHDPEFWQAVRPGDIIALTDEQAIQDSLEKGLGAEGMQYEVKRVTRIRELNELCEWLLFDLDSEEELRLMVKIVDNEIDIRIYFAAEEFRAGDRVDMLEQDCYWLFKEPEDPDNFDPVELQFTEELEWSVPLDNDGVVDNVLFQQKGFGELFGKVTITPAESGMDNLVASVVELVTNEDVPNPELLIMETGAVGSIVIDYDEEEDKETTEETETDSERRGGLIELFVGTPINLSEVEVFSPKED